MVLIDLLKILQKCFKQKRIILDNGYISPHGLVFFTEYVQRKLLFDRNLNVKILLYPAEIVRVKKKKMKCNLNV